MRHLKIKVHGRVQGVGFRYHAAREARKFGLAGFVRNEAAGFVHIEAEGDEEALKNFLAWCHEGPQLAKVAQLEEEWSDELCGFAGFRVEE